MLGGKCNNKRKNGKVRKHYYPKTPNQDIEIGINLDKGTPKGLDQV